jgi:hypothetical protein
VRRAEAWRWGSLWRREQGQGQGQGQALLADWPLPRPDEWRDRLNRAETATELEELRAAAQRGVPNAPSWLAPGLLRVTCGRGRSACGRPQVPNRTIRPAPMAAQPTKP